MTRVALLYRDGRGVPLAHSGSVEGMQNAIAALGYEPCVANAALPRPLESMIWRAANHPGLASLGERALLATVGGEGLREILRGRGTPTVLMTSEAAFVSWPRSVTFDDMTVAQLQRHPEYSSRDPRYLPRWRRHQTRMFEQAVAVCVGSHWAAQSVIDDYGIPAEKVVVAGRGHRFTAKPADGRDWSHPVFFFASRNWSRKNGGRVLRAFAQLRLTVPDAELHLAGDHPRVGADGVVGHGMLDLNSDSERRELESLYAKSTCFVMPSLCEAFGISYIEAASWGVASIGTTIGGAGTAIGNGGVLADPYSEEAIRAAMDFMCSPATAERLGRVAQERSEMFTWVNVAGRVMAALGLDGDVPNAVDRPKVHCFD